MDLTNLDFSNPVVAVAVIIGLIEIVKRVLPELDKRYLPLVALALGLLWSVGNHVGADVVAVIGIGVVVALSAMGSFSGGKALSGH